MSQSDIIPTAGKKPRFFYGYVVLGAALAIWIFSWGTNQAFGVLFKPAIEELGWTRAQLSGAFSLGSIVMALMGAVTGRLSDRFGPRLIITVFGSFLGIGYLLMSPMNAVWQAYVVWGILVGTGASVVGPALMSTLSRWFNKRRGLAIGVVSTGAGIGGMIFSPVAAWLALAYSWRFAWIILGIISLLIMISSGLLLKRRPAEAGQLPDGAAEMKKPETKTIQDSGPVQGISLSQALHTRQFWILCAILLCFGLNRGIMVHIAPHVSDIGYSLTAAANVMAVNAAVSIIGRLVMGQVADMIGGRRAFIISFILMPMAFLVIGIGRELWTFYLFAVLYGFAWGGLAVLRFSTAGELFGVSSLGAIMGIVEFFATAGSGITPIIAGHLFDINGNYDLTFLIFGIVGLIGFVLSWLITPVVPSDK